MTVRFQVSTRASGLRRTIDVYLYDTVEELRAAASNASPDHSFESTGGVCQVPSYKWPRPDLAWFCVIRLHRKQIDFDTVAHEATHAAMEIYHADIMKWNAKARAHFRADNEPIAYLVGEITERILFNLQRRNAWG